MSSRLSGKVAIVTGATAGIGAATARRLVGEGARVVIAGRSVERGEAIAAELGSPFTCGDLVSGDTPHRLVATAVESFGRLDILVNNAAADHTGDLLSTPVDQVRGVFEINFFAALRMLQAAGIVMAKQEAGTIINITSRLASVGVPSMSLYGASKGALQNLTRSAAVELAPLGIRVNAVAPGMTRTPLYDSWLSEQPDPNEAERQVLSGIPQRRLATPEDVAAAVAYLASDDATHITGVTLPVDGGYTAM